MTDDTLHGPAAAIGTRTGASAAVTAFARENVVKLDDLAALLGSLDDDAYMRPNEPASSASLGAHVRHILDFHYCLVRGVRSGTIDYERRDREAAIESDRRAALARLAALRRQILELARADDCTLDVTLVDLDGTARHGRSSLLRELEAALSHAVHHFAILEVLLRLRGIAPPANFGVAPSTVRYLQRQDEEQ